MKRFMQICLLAAACIALLLFAGCGNKTEERGGALSFAGYEMDDKKPLEGGLTKEYDLDELSAFFKDSNANERIGFGSDGAALTFREVNSSYPVEILRTGGYSVYKVRQGGYFYVFWAEPLPAEAGQSDSEPTVYFSAYLSGDRAPGLFDSLTPGVSTAEEVRRLDPSFELSFLYSSGIFSYSYRDEETVFQIEYTGQENWDGYDDLTVKEITTVARASASSGYSALLSADLP